jgi:CRISPR system Cascade subunit CasD
MKEYLLFRLYGPMAAWGDIAVGEFRPSFAHPSKSAMLGLAAAALGIRREEEAAHQKLASSYGFAVRVDALGVPLRDYHTAQVPPSGSGRNRRTFAARKDELAVPKETLGTILSTRDYRCDALYTVCLWSVADSPYSLQQIAAALGKPTFVPYLGRKSCPPGLPLHAQVLQAENLKNAFANVRFDDKDFLSGLTRLDSVPVYWEGDDSSFQVVHKIERRDTPLSRRRWQFSTRSENYGMESSTREPEE